MLGIENILCLTGDHTKMGDHPQAKPVFDLDSVSLLHTVQLLESGVDLGGNQLVGEPPKFSKGAVVSPCSDSVDAQLAKMERKVAAGADYFQTQAVCLDAEVNSIQIYRKKQNSSENLYSWYHHSEICRNG